MKVSAEVRRRFKNTAHQGAFLKGRRAAVLEGLDAKNPYELIEINNGRNGNSFSIGLHNAWKAGFDEQARELEDTLPEIRDRLAGVVPNNLAEVA